MTGTVRAVVLSGPGPVADLAVTRLPVPGPAPGVGVRVKVAAFGSNRNEWVVHDSHPIGCLPKGVRLPAYGGESTGGSASSSGRLEENPGGGVDVVVRRSCRGRQPDPRSARMTQYLISVIEPTGYDIPEQEVLERITKEVEAVDADMRASGVWVFSGGLHAPETATTLRPRDDGELVVTDGPFSESKEHVGGFNIIDVPDLDAALEWGRRMSVACTLPVEVRPFQDFPG